MGLKYGYFKYGFEIFQQKQVYDSTLTLEA